MAPLKRSVLVSFAISAVMLLATVATAFANDIQVPFP
jgi:hypothetical protein